MKMDRGNMKRSMNLKLVHNCENKLKNILHIKETMTIYHPLTYSLCHK